MARHGYYGIILWIFVCLQCATSQLSDSTECTVNPCLQGKCSLLHNTHFCTCNVGWTGMFCDKDIYSCSWKPCLYGNCSVTVDGYQCSCFEGWTGPDCDQRTSSCSAKPCVHGKCTSILTSYYCTCDSGWFGRNCDQSSSLCNPNPCEHGSCITSQNNYVCLCVSGWKGANCELDIDECVLNPCLHGQCKNELNGFSCLCKNGWSGTHCDEEIKECSSNPCANGTCVEQVNGYVCNCSTGWSGERCDQEATTASTSSSISTTHSQSTERTTHSQITERFSSDDNFSNETVTATPATSSLTSTTKAHNTDGNISKPIGTASSRSSTTGTNSYSTEKVSSDDKVSKHIDTTIASVILSTSATNTYSTENASLDDKVSKHIGPVTTSASLSTSSTNMLGTDKLSSDGNISKHLSALIGGSVGLVALIVLVVLFIIVYRRMTRKDLKNVDAAVHFSPGRKSSADGDYLQICDSHVPTVCDTNVYATPEEIDNVYNAKQGRSNVNFHDITQPTYLSKQRNTTIRGTLDEPTQPLNDYKRFRPDNDYIQAAKIGESREVVFRNEQLVERNPFLCKPPRLPNRNQPDDYKFYKGQCDNFGYLHMADPPTSGSEGYRGVRHMYPNNDGYGYIILEHDNLRNANY